MIYIIDDKRSRQQDYGWDEGKLAHYRNLIIPIWDYEGLVTYRDVILEQGNVILFHESFLSSTDFDKNYVIDSLKADLKKNIYRL